MKLKNKKGLLKRVKITGKKKGLRGAPGRRHLLGTKKAKKKRQLRKKRLLTTAEKTVLKRSVPYM